MSLSIVNQFDDKTDYTSTAIQNTATGFAPGSDKDWFKLRNGKSINVNIWFFMQKLNVVKHVVNLKYGLGLELNNYHYRKNVIYQTQPTKIILDQSTGDSGPGCFGSVSPLNLLCGIQSKLSICSRGTLDDCLV